MTATPHHPHLNLNADYSALSERDPAHQLQQLRAQWQAQPERWVFAYASLLWKREFEAAEQRTALLHGWHRALRMRSRVNRGSPEQPGLVFALLQGGACRGAVYRLHAARADAELDLLWAREMPTGVYDARLLPCRTPGGAVQALAFTLSRRSPSCLAPLSNDEMLRIFRHAHGRYGSTVDYLAETARELAARGIRDREVQRLLALAQSHGLAGA